MEKKNIATLGLEERFILEDGPSGLLKSDLTNHQIADATQLILFSFSYPINMQELLKLSFKTIEMAQLVCEGSWGMKSSYSGISIKSSES